MKALTEHTDLNAELSDLKTQLAKLEAEKTKREAEAKQKEAARKAQETREKAADALFAALKNMGVQVPDVQATEPIAFQAAKPIPPIETPVVAEPSKELGRGISTQRGLYVMLGVFALFFLVFIGYGVFSPLNDSEVRITNAAYLHFISHIWLSISVILSGFGVQFLLFNQQSRYLWTNVQTEQSFQTDFWKPSYEGLIRLVTCLFTWAFPTFIIAWVFQLILG